MSKKKTTKEFQDDLNLIFGEGAFEVLSEYKANNQKVKIKCHKCGGIIEKAPVKMTGSAREGCYICNGKDHYKTKETFQAEIDGKYPQQFVILGDYVRAREPLLIKSLTCGHEYLVSPDNLLRGKGCPRCSIRQSSYMDVVEKFLDANGIEYEKEKVFPECKDIRNLPFDYYIPSYNCCIEVDGEFHYERKGASLNRKSEYESVKRRDGIKTDFCVTHNIHLIRLPYFKLNDFSSILANELQVNTEITV